MKEVNRMKFDARSFLVIIMVVALFVCGCGDDAGVDDDSGGGVSVTITGRVRYLQFYVGE